MILYSYQWTCQFNFLENFPKVRAYMHIDMLLFGCLPGLNFSLGAGRVEVVECVIHDDPQWSKKQEEIKSLDPKYNAAWKMNVR